MAVIFFFFGLLDTPAIGPNAVPHSSEITRLNSNSDRSSAELLFNLTQTFLTQASSTVVSRYQMGT